MTERTKAYAAMTLQCAIIALSYIAIKIGLESSDPVDMLAHRFSLSFLTMLALWWYRPSWFQISWSSFKALLPCTIFFPILFFYTQTEGLEYITSSQTGIIYALSPIFTVLVAGWLIKEKISSRQWFYMLLSIAGVVYINIMNTTHLAHYSVKGFLFILASALSFGFYTVLTKKLVQGYFLGTILFFMMGMGCAFFMSIALAQHLMAGTVGGYFAELLNPVYFFCVASLGLLASIYTTYLGAYALQRIPSTTVGLLNNLSVIMSIFAGVLLMHNPLYWYHIVGVGIILFGTIAFTKASKS